MNKEPSPVEEKPNNEAVPVPQNHITLGSVIDAAVDQATTGLTDASSGLLSKGKTRGGGSPYAAKDAAKKNKKKKAERIARKKQRKVK